MLLSMDFPAGMFLKPVDGDEDLFQFGFDFMLEGKALQDGEGVTDVVTEDENGDLIIEGWAAVFDGTDRQGENFIDGAFEHGVKAFLEGPAALCYHHKKDMALGKVLELENVPDKGLKIKARVDGEIKAHPILGPIYGQIKKGTLSALSIGGFFKRGIVNGARKIIDTDFTEISVTPVPVHTGPRFAVVAGKALTDALTIPDGVAVTVDKDTIRDEDFAEIQWSIDTLGRILTRINKRGEDDSQDKPTGDLAIAL